MTIADRLEDCISREAALCLRQNMESLREIRIRIGQPIQIVAGENFRAGGPVDSKMMKNMLLKLTDFSLYSREEEVKSGYFTLDDGSRVGICGKAACQDGKIVQLTHVGSMVIRISRACPGCAGPVIESMIHEDNLLSTLVFSAPGMGKTTMLRDIARQLSGLGHQVAIADERHEIAACIQGVPGMDVGPCTDVMDGCPKGLAVGQIVRAMSPEVLVTDEIGHRHDAEALSDAVRCGVTIVASAHGESLEALLNRPILAQMLQEGLFKLLVQLGERPGKIIGQWQFQENHREGGRFLCV